MKLTGKQRTELEILRWYVPSNYVHKRITDKQIADFFAWSDRGVAHGRNVMSDADGFCALYHAKRMRDLQITSWKEGIEDGLLTKSELYDDMPAAVQADTEKRLASAMLGSPMFEHKNGEMVFVGYEKPDAVDFRLRFGRSVLSKS